jgi:magnesium-transporting ATPase (P-type)
VSVAGILRGEEPFNMLITGISLAVAAVPEGLPAIVTISLALAVNRILRRRALIRRLHSVETLGLRERNLHRQNRHLTENRMTAKRFSPWIIRSPSAERLRAGREFTVGTHRAVMSASAHPAPPAGYLRRLQQRGDHALRRSARKPRPHPEHGHPDNGTPSATHGDRPARHGGEGGMSRRPRPASSAG